MKVTQTITLAAGLMTLTVMPVFAQQAPAANPAAPPRRAPLVLTSTAFLDSTPIPPKYTCSAQGTPVSIPLAWTEPRPGTVSFALLFHDLEAVMHKSTEDVTHWMTWNIPADVRELPEGFRPYRRRCGNPGFARHAARDQLSRKDRILWSLPRLWFAAPLYLRALRSRHKADFTSGCIAQRL